MKKFAKFMAAGVIVAIIGVMAVSVMADEVVPANVTLTCLRNEVSSAAVTNITYIQGNTLSLSNSVMHVGADTNSALQNLDGCVITVVAGQPGSTITNNITATGYNISTNDGTWGVEFVIPPRNPCYIEVTVSNNAVFTYPRYRIDTSEPLPEP